MLVSDDDVVRIEKQNNRFSRRPRENVDVDDDGECTVNRTAAVRAASEET